MKTTKLVKIYEEETQSLIGESELTLDLSIEKDLSVKLQVPDQVVEVECLVESNQVKLQKCFIKKIQVSIHPSHGFDGENEIYFKIQGLWLTSKEQAQFKEATGYLWVEI